MAQDWSKIKKPKGFASGFESDVAAELVANNVSFTYEAMSIAYTTPGKDVQFTPQFILEHNGIVLQSIGYLDGALRQKLLLLKKQHPALDLRLILRSPNARLSKRSGTTAAMWCGRFKFQYAATVPPKAWLSEPVNLKSLAVVASMKAAANRTDPVKQRIEQIQRDGD
jgi:hypothetical protein